MVLVSVSFSHFVVQIGAKNGFAPLIRYFHRNIYILVYPARAPNSDRRMRKVDKVIHSEMDFIVMFVMIFIQKKKKKNLLKFRFLFSFFFPSSLYFGRDDPYLRHLIWIYLRCGNYNKCVPIIFYSVIFLLWWLCAMMIAHVRLFLISGSNKLEYEVNHLTLIRI